MKTLTELMQQICDKNPAPPPRTYLMLGVLEPAITAIDAGACALHPDDTTISVLATFFGLAPTMVVMQVQAAAAEEPPVAKADAMRLLRDLRSMLRMAQMMSNPLYIEKLVRHMAALGERAGLTDDDLAVGEVPIVHVPDPGGTH